MNEQEIYDFIGIKSIQELEDIIACEEKRKSFIEKKKMQYLNICYAKGDAAYRGDTKAAKDFSGKGYMLYMLLTNILGDKELEKL